MRNEFYKKYYLQFKEWLRESHINIYENRWQISNLLDTLKELSKFDRYYYIRYIRDMNEFIKIYSLEKSIIRINTLWFDHIDKELHYLSSDGRVICSSYHKEINIKTINDVLKSFTSYGKSSN